MTAVNKPDCEEKICSSAKSAFAAMMRGKKKVGVAGDSAGGSTPATAAGSASPPDEECPEDRESLGRSSWSLLHSMAAYYPNSPDDRRRDDTRQFLHLFSVLYPCTHCAEDLREWMTAHPPVTSSRATLSKWMCEAHNEVNTKLNKPTFPCDEAKLDLRWRTGSDKCNNDLAYDDSAD